MSYHRPTHNDIQRLWQEAEVYESQGLFDQAITVYQSILNKDPDNRKAQAKVVQIQFSQRMSDSAVGTHTPEEDFSPRLALDLGLAYMGMNLYAEALSEFRKAADISTPTDRAELLRYIASCLLRVKRFEDAKITLDRAISDSALTPEQKGQIVEEMVSICLEEQLTTEARDLLLGVPDELHQFVRNYDLVARQSKSKDAQGRDFVILLEDSRTGAVYDAGTTAVTSSQEMASPPKEAGKVLEPSIPLETRIDYSFDNKNWREGKVSRLAGDWALVHIFDEAEQGETVVLKIYLPGQPPDDPVWVISRITRAEALPGAVPPFTAKVRFVSFLPGGEATLKTFIDNLVNNPSGISQSVEPSAAESDQDQYTTDIFASLQAEAVRAMEAAMLADQEEEDEGPPTPTDKRDAEEQDVTEPKPVRAKRAAIPRIRFACQCGQVHVVPAKHVGRKGTCSGCQQTITVPVVDTRPDSVSEQLIGKSVGGCRLVYKIGGGGMGGVFKAHHLALDIPVAVKVLHGHLADKDPVFIRRFIREARAAAKLQHPNIVGVMNVGFERGVHYLIMPFVGGGSAAALLARVGKLPLVKVLQIGIEISRALVVAEENKVLHRDIKPANILFNSRGEAMLADLGLAKQYLDSQDAGITQTGITCGTPLYFSPEQAKGVQNLDIRSDVYSLGITLYHLLTGSPPFIGESAYVIFQKHVHDPLPPFKDPDIPFADQVFKVLQKMTAKTPEERFQSSEEILQGLEELRDELVHMNKSTSGAPKKGLLERLGIKKS